MKKRHFDMETAHPITEEEMIKIEKIHLSIIYNIWDKKRRSKQQMDISNVVVMFDIVMLISGQNTLIFVRNTDK